MEVAVVQSDMLVCTERIKLASSLEERDVSAQGCKAGRIVPGGLFTYVTL